MLFQQNPREQNKRTAFIISLFTIHSSLLFCFIPQGLKRRRDFGWYASSSLGPSCPPVPPLLLGKLPESYPPLTGILFLIHFPWMGLQKFEWAGHLPECSSLGKPPNWGYLNHWGHHFAEPGRVWAYHNPPVRKRRRFRPASLLRPVSCLFPKFQLFRFRRGKQVAHLSLEFTFELQILLIHRPHLHWAQPFLAQPFTIILHSLSSGNRGHFCNMLHTAQYVKSSLYLLSSQR